LPSVDEIFVQEGAAQFPLAQKISDGLARKAAGMKWSSNLTKSILTSLANTGSHFRKKGSAQPIQARRAERLVLALDRLVLALDKKLRSALDADVSQLYALIQSLPDFEPPKFAEALEKFAGKLAKNISE